MLPVMHNLNCVYPCSTSLTSVFVFTPWLIIYKDEGEVEHFVSARRLEKCGRTPAVEILSLG